MKKNTINSPMDDLINNFFNYNHIHKSHGNLHADYFIEDTALYINVDVAGASSDDVAVEVDKYQNCVTVRVAKQYERKDNKPSFYIRERVLSEQSRTFELPREVIFGTETATVKNGLLTIRCDLNANVDCVSKYSLNVIGED